MPGHTLRHVQCGFSGCMRCIPGCVAHNLAMMGPSGTAGAPCHHAEAATAATRRGRRSQDSSTMACESLAGFGAGRGGSRQVAEVPPAAARCCQTRLRLCGVPCLARLTVCSPTADGTRGMRSIGNAPLRPQPCRYAVDASWSSAHGGAWVGCVEAQRLLGARRRRRLAPQRGRRLGLEGPPGRSGPLHHSGAAGLARGRLQCQAVAPRAPAAAPTTAAARRGGVWAPKRASGRSVRVCRVVCFAF